MQKLWFSIFDFSFNYKGNEPSFIPTESFDWAKELSANAGIIKDELLRYLEKNNLESYFNSSMVAKKDSWKTIALKTWSIELYKNQKEFPFTTALLNKYPQIISASFNLLEPESSILPHCGDTNAIYRCHMGLEIPAPLPHCGFKVKNESHSWEYSKWLVFMDAYQHEAWNNTKKPRYIFLMDVLRDEFSTKKNRVVSTVLTSLFLQKRLEKYKFLGMFHHPALAKLITKLLRPFALLATKFANRYKLF